MRITFIQDRLLSLNGKKWVCGLQDRLLKDQLEVVKVQVDGRTRYSIKPIEGQLTFDKVCQWRPWQ